MRGSLLVASTTRPHKGKETSQRPNLKVAEPTCTDGLAEAVSVAQASRIAAYSLA